MAWTSSAGPEGTFALADGTCESATTLAEPRRHDRASSTSSRPFTLLTVAHLCGLGIVAPFAESTPLVAIPAAFGLAVAYLTLGRPHRLDSPTAAAGTQQAAVAALVSAAPSNETFTEPSSRDIAPPASAIILHASAVEGPIAATEVSADLRVELMARVSHELRTPLNAVMGFSDLMGHQMFGPLGHPRYEEYVSHIRESSQRLLKSAEDTLAMTSLMAKSAGQCEREPLELAAIVKDAKSSLAGDMRRAGILCTVDIDPDIEVVAHRRALRQALVNILCEAVARSEDGASLRISASLDHDRVALLLTADRTLPENGEEHRSLPLCLARTLLELDGCQLFDNIAPQQAWSVLVSLDAAVQPDFFSASFAPEACA